MSEITKEELTVYVLISYILILAGTVGLWGIYGGCLGMGIMIILPILKRMN